MKTKIAFIVVGLNAGGIENYLLRFLIFYKHKIDATVYCKSGTIGELEEEYLTEEIRLKKFPLGHFNPKHYLNLKKEFKKENYDAVVDFTGNFAGLTLWVSQKAGITTRIVWYRNADDKFKKTTFRLLYNKFVNHLTLKKATNILSNSEAALNHFYKDYEWKADRRFDVIYNGIDANKFLNSNENLREEYNIPKDAFVVGNIGRFNEQKNHVTAIEVAIFLCTAHYDIFFIFCGKGVDEAYTGRIKNLGLQNRIILTGVRRDIIKVLNTLDCFYFPSILEGQPNALIEAMLVGTPFVASDIEPVKETVPKNLHKYLVPPLDRAKAEKAILKIKNDADYSKLFKISEWAKKSFNSEIQFELFFDKIK